MTSIVKPTNVHDTLVMARDLIATNGKYRGGYWDSSYRDCRVCALGALALTQYTNPHNVDVSVLELTCGEGAPLLAAATALKNALPLGDLYSELYDSITVYSDNHSEQEVIAWFNRAIDGLEEIK